MAEIASEILRTRGRISELDRRLEELLAEDPKARIVRSMPGMGVAFTADSLAAAAGVAPVLRASGARSHRRRASRGNK
ncbi:MAG TPA: hypothetical protein VFY59_15660, partial [Rubrobacter sp.]|nr:hypothetical protein [Rubrobacter sp.]